ncbi:MAG TPA: type III restriction-modification system endonuclease [Desulfovibrio sp.]|nr:type III restriction-modification system endonuclease [Desulfovibrio sp.]
MELFLEQLPHQEEALQCILKEFSQKDNSRRKAEANPDVQVKNFIDVKMETGTGKTYVYTRIMYELFAEYGLQKFIIVVPSLAIKEGTKNFIKAQYVQKHLNEVLKTNYTVALSVINSKDFETKKGRKTIPSHLKDFLDGSMHEKNTVFCLLINDAMLRSMETKEFDQTLLDSYSKIYPAIKAIKPIIIIDEPHRFKQDNKAMRSIQELAPQCILRFGATFPEIEVGTGKNKQKKIDYKNLVYDLNALSSFNQRLVKGVNIQYPSLIKEESSIYKVVGLTNTALTLKKDNKKYQIEKGELLPDDFGGNLYYVGGKEKLLSNGLNLESNMQLVSDVFLQSYQEILLKQAIDTHFKKEKENWEENIKTLSLFFIDDIKSYRNKENEGWLKQKFEELLKHKLEALIKEETNQEYKEFLKESLKNIGQTHAGYFAEDTGKADEEIQKQIDDILRNKSEMLSFKDKNSAWVVRRFFFSKWTLREGWDNPNIFVITKLRKSGSEISKIQEVGRGLRLPVNASGKRMSNTDKDYYLDLIIDWSEKDFAQSLKEEIVSDNKQLYKKITDELCDIVLQKQGKECTEKNRDELFISLLTEKIINREGEITNFEEFVKYLPEEYVLKENIITENGRKNSKVKLRKENWEKIRELWKQITKRFMVEYDQIPNEDLKNILKHSLKNNAFQLNSGTIVHKKLVVENDMLVIKETTEDLNFPVGTLPYGVFLQKLSMVTNIPVHIIHKAMCELYPDGVNKEQFNINSVNNINVNFEKEFAEYFSTRYEYNSLDFIAATSLMKDGVFLDEIEQNLLGLKEDKTFEVEKNYLYDKKVFDSGIEQDILKEAPQKEVLVFGKLPRRSVKVPLYTGGTTSPDFVYAIKNNKQVQVGLIVEAKSDNLREKEISAINAQEKYFKQFDKIKWKKVTSVNEFRNCLKSLIKEE